jgi:hypothetical protein
LLRASLVSIFPLLSFSLSSLSLLLLSYPFFDLKKAPNNDMAVDSIVYIRFDQKVDAKVVLSKIKLVIIHHTWREGGRGGDGDGEGISNSDIFAGSVREILQRLQVIFHSSWIDRRKPSYAIFEC